MPAAKAQQDFLTRDDALRWVRKLMPLRHLSEQEFEIITTDTSVEFCAAGGTLFRSGQDDHFIFYLLSGKIAIRDREGNAFSIVGGSIEARHSLTPHAKARVCATAKTAVQFVRLPANLINLQHQDSEGITVDTIDEHEAAFDKRILFDVYHWLMSGDLVLPSLPDIALRIRQAAANENVAVEDIARIVQSDASTSAYCISVANSAALGGSSPVANVLDAVVRIGTSATRDLVVAYTIRSLFTGKDVASKNLMRNAWKHSCRIAALSYVLARDVARLSPERALLAGLLHDIGISVIIDTASKHTSLLTNIEAFKELCVELSGQIGAMILRAWNFPDVFVQAALEAETFNKPVADRLQLCDVVMLAHLHDRQPAPWSLSAVNLSELAIRHKLLAHDITEDHGLAVIEAADRELQELTQLLSC